MIWWNPEAVFFQCWLFVVPITLGWALRRLKVWKLVSRWWQIYFDSKLRRKMVSLGGNGIRVYVISRAWCSLRLIKRNCKPFSDSLSNLRKACYFLSNFIDVMCSWPWQAPSALGLYIQSDQNNIWLTLIPKLKLLVLRIAKNGGFAFYRLDPRLHVVWCNSSLHHVVSVVKNFYAFLNVTSLLIGFIRVLESMGPGSVD